MDAREIAKALTEAVLARVDLTSVMGQDIKPGDVEAIGKKVGELYKGILTEVVNALKSEKPDKIKTRQF